MFGWLAAGVALLAARAVHAAFRARARERVAVLGCCCPALAVLGDHRRGRARARPLALARWAATPLTLLGLGALLGAPAARLWAWPAAPSRAARLPGWRRSAPRW